MPAAAGVQTRGLAVRAGLSVLAASLLVLLSLPSSLWPVTLPLLVVVNLAVWSLVVLTANDSSLPVFELGTVCIGFTAIYTAYPLFAFLMSGGAWSGLSDNRLQQWNPDARELGAFAWRYVVYLGAFVVGYLPLRRTATASGLPMRPLSNAGTLALVWLALLLITYFAALWVVRGVTYTPSYEDVERGVVGLPQDLPHVVQQLSHNLKGILLLLKICGIAVLMHRWHSPVHRTLLIVWLVAEVVATAARMGARSETAFLLVSVVLLYHRLVRPLTFRRIALAGTVLVILLLGYGFARDFRHARAAADSASYWSAANEFQVIMGTGFDLHKRQTTGALGRVPWQVYASEPLMLIPSQLLPFAKIDPAEWYLAQLGLDSRQIGLMFGVMAQAAIGYDWGELMARGFLLGVLFAGIHRVYVRHARSFWWSILYLYVCLWSYYTVRASSLYFLYVVVYRFVPTLTIVCLAAWLVRVAVQRQRGLPTASVGIMQ